MEIIWRDQQAFIQETAVKLAWWCVWADGWLAGRKGVPAEHRKWRRIVPA